MLAGFVHDELFDTAGKALGGASVRVKKANSNEDAILYTSATKATTAANPTQADPLGNVSFWADNGEYDLVVTPVGRTAQSPYKVRTIVAPGLPDHLARKGPVANIQDFGAVGDGVVRKVTAAQLNSKAALGFSGAHRLDDFDAEDTQDWLATALAVKHVTSKGSGTVYVPRPAVSYPIRRFIPTPPGVPIRILGDGYQPGRFDFDNVCDLPTGWNETERRSVFQSSTFALQALVSGGLGASTQVAMAAQSVGYSHVIPLAAGGGASFAAGNRVVIYHTGNYPTGATVCPHRLAFRRVVAVSGDELLLDDVLPFVLPSGTGRVAKMGTGSNGSLGGAPYDFVEGLEIRGLNVRGTGLLGFGVAGRNCHFEDFGVQADRAVSPLNAIGLSLNGFVDTTARLGRITTTNRAIEIKAGSGGRWNYDPDSERGGTGLLVQDMECRQIGAGTGLLPMVATGESSNCKLERVSMIANAATAATFLKIVDSEVTVLRDLYFHADGADSSKQAIEMIGHTSPQDRSILDVGGSRLGGRPAKWIRYIISGDPGGGRPGPVLIDDGMRAGSTFGSTFSTVAFGIAFVTHGTVSNFASEVGQTIGFTAASTVMSPVKDALGATATQIASATSWINTSYKGWGRDVYDTTNNRLLFPTGRTATAAWRPYNGSADVVPA